MSINGMQGRIAQIQSALAVTASPPASAPTRGSPAAGTQFAAALDQALQANQSSTAPTGWTAPAKGTVSSEFGPRWGSAHEGIDIAAGSGSPVQAAADGVVRKASWYGGYGNAVIIDHGDGVTTLYGHNSHLDVKPGERVSAGQIIAKVGSTGDSTGPHLHFEVEVDGKKVDPRPWLTGHGVSL